MSSEMIMVIMLLFIFGCSALFMWVAGLAADIIGTVADLLYGDRNHVTFLTADEPVEYGPDTLDIPFGGCR